MDGFRVDDTALGAHAGHVDELAGRMQAAAEAGAPLGLGAYGVVGQVFAAAAVDATRTGSRAVRQLADVVHDRRDGVAATRAGYLAAERRNAAMFGEPS